MPPRDFLFPNLSIGIYMIIYNCSKVNSKNIEKKIKEYENINNITGFCCPCCGSKDAVYYGSYRRNVIDINGQRVETIINIKRLQCSSCKKVHAIIPSFLIPYKQHTIDTINKILVENITEDKSYNEIEEATGVSRQLQKKWKDQFELLKGKLEVLFLVFAFKKLMKNIKSEKNIIERFYSEYKEIYMLNRRRIFYSYVST